MPTREEMRRLGDEIVRSYENRIGGIARVKEAEGERKRTTAKKIAHRRSDAGARVSDVGAMLSEFREDKVGARDEWQKATATMQSKQDGVAVAVKPPVEEIAKAVVQQPEAHGQRGGDRPPALPRALRVRGDFLP